MNEITTCSFFKVQGLGNKWWAFKQMQIGLSKLKSVHGLRFFKLLGTGSKNGFSSIPNFGTYVLLCVWDSEEESTAFFTQNAFFNAYKSRSAEQFTVYLKAAESHGNWDGLRPFTPNVKLDMEKPVFVLTRARIRFNKLLSFWRRVAKVSLSLEKYDGLIFSIGVGEWPLFQQATVSIWQTQAEMLDYAYKNPKHKEVVQLTRKLGWYKEEIFARFLPYKMAGTWDGRIISNQSFNANLSTI